MSSKLLRAFSSSTKFDKDEQLDFLFWCRVIIAFAFGVGAGILKFTGVYVIIIFFVALFLISYIYYSKILNIYEEQFA